jgi:2'-5' RNA ligase superfamily
MALTAIDVALLPPPPLAQHAIELSASLPHAESQGVLLGPDHLPHVTLVQAFVDADESADVFARIDEILRRQAPLDLHVFGGAAGARSVWIGIDRTPALVDLHTRLMAAVLPYERRDGDASAFFGNDARDRDVHWVAHFRTASSFDAFRPHITLGHAAEPPAIPPCDVRVDSIAACHLGRFCSCRRVLRAWSLAA